MLSAEIVNHIEKNLLYKVSTPIGILHGDLSNLISDWRALKAENDNLKKEKAEMKGYYMDRIFALEAENAKLNKFVEVVEKFINDLKIKIERFEQEKK